MAIDVIRFPSVPTGSKTLYGYFDEDETLILEHKGYRVQNLMTMPRNSDKEQQLFILAKLQAMDEHTIEASSEDRRLLMLEAQVYGMLNPKSTRLNINMNLDAEQIDDVLAWQRSRHTLRDNTTVVGATGKSLESIKDASVKKVETAKKRALAKVSGLRQAEGRSKRKKKSK